MPFPFEASRNWVICEWGRFCNSMIIQNVLRLQFLSDRSCWNVSQWLSFISHTIDSFTCCPLDQVFVYKLVPPPLSHRYVEEESSFLRNKSCELARYISTQYFIVCFCLRLFSGSPSASHESLKSFSSPSLARKPVTACDYRLYLGSFTFLWLWRIKVVCKSRQAILCISTQAQAHSIGLL